MSSNLVKLEYGDDVLGEGGKLDNLVKNPRVKSRTNKKLNPYKHWAGIEHSLDCKRSHHCAFPHTYLLISFFFEVEVGWGGVLYHGGGAPVCLSTTEHILLTKQKVSSFLE